MGPIGGWRPRKAEGRRSRLDQSVLRPRDLKDLQAIVLDCAAGDRPLMVNGGGTRARLGRGRTPSGAAALDLSAFSGIRAIDLERGLIVAGAATPLHDIDDALQRTGRILPFEPSGPWDPGPPGADRPTIGGVVASNASGPRRLAAGAARDHLIGFSGITGRGDPLASSRPARTEPTSFDLAKIIGGSWGTLCIMTEVVLAIETPPERRVTLAVGVETPSEGLGVIAAALDAKPPPASAALLEAEALAALGVDMGTRRVACLRLETTPQEAERRINALWARLDRDATIEVVDGDEEARLWRAVADLDPLKASPLPLWRISCAPTTAQWLLETAQPNCAYADCAGGVVWLRAMDPPRLTPDEGQAHYWGGAESAAGLHPQLNPEEIALSRRLKLMFDPRRILNRGRCFPPQLETDCDPPPSRPQTV